MPPPSPPPQPPPSPPSAPQYVAEPASIAGQNTYGPAQVGMYVPPTGDAAGGNGTRRLLATADDFTVPVDDGAATVVFSISLAPGVLGDLGGLGLGGLYGVRAVTAGESAAHAISSQLVELLEPQPAGVAAGYAAGRFQFSGYLVESSTEQIDVDSVTLFPFTVNGTAGGTGNGQDDELSITVTPPASGQPFTAALGAGSSFSTGIKLTSPPQLFASPSIGCYEGVYGCTSCAVTPSQCDGAYACTCLSLDAIGLCTVAYSYSSNYCPDTTGCWPSAFNGLCGQCVIQGDICSACKCGNWQQVSSYFYELPTSPTGAFQCTDPLPANTEIYLVPATFKAACYGDAAVLAVSAAFYASSTIADPASLTNCDFSAPGDLVGRCTSCACGWDAADNQCVLNPDPTNVSAACLQPLCSASSSMPSDSPTPSGSPTPSSPTPSDSSAPSGNYLLQQTIGWRQSASFSGNINSSDTVSLFNGQTPQFDNFAGLLTDPPLNSTLQSAQLPTDALSGTLRAIGDCSAGDLGLGYTQFFYTSISGYIYFPFGCSWALQAIPAVATYDNPAYIVYDMGYRITIDGASNTYLPGSSAPAAQYPDPVGNFSIVAQGWAPFTLEFYIGSTDLNTNDNTEASLRLQWASTSVDPDVPGTPVFTTIPSDYLGSDPNQTVANVTLPADPVAGCCMMPGDPACTAPPPQSPSPDPPMPSTCGQPDPVVCNVTDDCTGFSLNSSTYNSICRVCFAPDVGDPPGACASCDCGFNVDYDDGMYCEPVSGNAECPTICPTQVPDESVATLSTTDGLLQTVIDWHHYAAPVTLSSTDDYPPATLLPGASPDTVWQDFSTLEAMATVPTARRIAPALDSLTTDGSCDLDSRTYTMGLYQGFYTNFQGQLYLPGGPGTYCPWTFQVEVLPQDLGLVSSQNPTGNAGYRLQLNDVTLIDHPSELLDSGAVRDSNFVYLSGGLVDFSLDNYVGAGNDVWLDVRIKSDPSEDEWQQIPEGWLVYNATVDAIVAGDVPATFICPGVQPPPPPPPPSPPTCGEPDPSTCPEGDCSSYSLNSTTYESICRVCWAPNSDGYGCAQCDCGYVPQAPDYTTCTTGDSSNCSTICPSQLAADQDPATLSTADGLLETVVDWSHFTAPITLYSGSDFPPATLFPGANPATVFQDLANLETMTGIVPIAQRIAPVVDSLTADVLHGCSLDNRTFSMGLQTTFFASFRGQLYLPASCSWAVQVRVLPSDPVSPSPTGNVGWWLTVNGLALTGEYSQLLDTGTTVESTEMYIYSSGLFNFALDYYVGTGSYAYLDVQIKSDPSEDTWQPIPAGWLVYNQPADYVSAADIPSTFTCSGLQPTPTPPITVVPCGQPNPAYCLNPPSCTGYPDEAPFAGYGGYSSICRVCYDDTAGANAGTCAQCECGWAPDPSTGGATCMPSSDSTSPCPAVPCSDAPAPPESLPGGGLLEYVGDWSHLIQPINVSSLDEIDFTPVHPIYPSQPGAFPPWSILEELREQADQGAEVPVNKRVAPQLNDLEASPSCAPADNSAFNMGLTRALFTIFEGYLWLPIVDGYSQCLWQFQLEVSDVLPHNVGYRLQIDGVEIINVQDALDATQTITTGDTYGLTGGTTHNILLEYYLGASSNASLDLKLKSTDSEPTFQSIPADWLGYGSGDFVGTTPAPDSFCCFAYNCGNRRRSLLANSDAADSAVTLGSNTDRSGMQSSLGLSSSSSETRHLLLANSSDGRPRLPATVRSLGGERAVAAPTSPPIRHHVDRAYIPLPTPAPRRHSDRGSLAGASAITRAATKQVAGPPPLQGGAAAPPPLVPPPPAAPGSQIDVASLGIQATVPTGPHTSYLVLSAVNGTSGQLTVVGSKNTTEGPAGNQNAPASSQAAQSVGAASLNAANDLISVFGDTPLSTFLAKAARIAFWVLAAMCTVLALHLALVLIFRLRRRHLPAMLEFPRLELFLLLFLIAPIGQIAAQLVASGDSRWRAGGWTIFAVGCVGLLGGGVFVVYRSVHRKASRQACFALLNVEEDKPKQSTAAWLWDVTVARLFCGPPQPEAEWVAVNNVGQLRFIARHGVLFEDNRGPLYKYVNPDGPEAAGSEASFGTDEEKRLAQEESRRTAAPAADVESPQAAAATRPAEPAGEIQAAAEAAGGPAATAPAAAPQSPFAMASRPMSPPDSASAAEPESQAVEEAYMRGGMAAVEALRRGEALDQPETEPATPPPGHKAADISSSNSEADTPTTPEAPHSKGKLQPVPVPQLVRIWGFEATAADLRAYATLLWVAKTLLTGYVIVSLQQKQSVAAVIFVVVAVVAWLAYNRILLPMAERFEQGIEIFASCCDVVCFGSALALALSPVSSVHYSEIMGTIIVASQGAAIWAFVLSRPIAFWPYMRLTLGPRLRILATGLPRWMRRRQTPAPAAPGGPSGAARPAALGHWSATFVMRAAGALGGTDVNRDAAAAGTGAASDAGAHAAAAAAPGAALAGMFGRRRSFKRSLSRLNPRHWSFRRSDSGFSDGADGDDGDDGIFGASGSFKNRSFRRSGSSRRWPGAVPPNRAASAALPAQLEAVPSDDDTGSDIEAPSPVVRSSMDRSFSAPDTL